MCFKMKLVLKIIIDVYKCVLKKFLMVDIFEIVYLYMVIKYINFIDVLFWNY